jgi:hypothetical protein
VNIDLLTTFNSLPTCCKINFCPWSTSLTRSACLFLAAAQSSLHMRQGDHSCPPSFIHSPYQPRTFPAHSRLLMQSSGPDLNLTSLSSSPSIRPAHPTGRQLHFHCISPKTLQDVHRVTRQRLNLKDASSSPSLLPSAAIWAGATRAVTLAT